MITIGFERIGDGVFVPHTDVLRALNRTFRRAGICVEYSKGFNRHMSLKMTQPLPLGVSDGDCYVTADISSDVSAKELSERFKENCPPYLKLKSAFVTEKNPSLASVVNASTYVVVGRLTDEQIAAINSLPDEYKIEVKTKSGLQTKDVAPLIYGVKADCNGFKATLAFGNVNLRIDKLCESFNLNFGTDFNVTDCIRTEQSIIADGKKITAADFTEAQCIEKFISK